VGYGGVETPACMCGDVSVNDTNDNATNKVGCIDMWQPFVLTLCLMKEAMPPGTITHLYAHLRICLGTGS
jgi:hypothetical protein